MGIQGKKGGQEGEGKKKLSGFMTGCEEGNGLFPWPFLSRLETVSCGSFIIVLKFF